MLEGGHAGGKPDGIGSLYTSEIDNKHSFTRIFFVVYISFDDMEAGYMNSSTLTALAEPNRLQIVDLLRGGPLTVGEIGDRLHLRQPQVSKHLKVLYEAHIVEVRPAANRRIYKLRPEPLHEMYAWLDTFCSMWEDQLNRLDEYLHEQKGKKNL